MQDSPPEHPFHLVPEKMIRESLDYFQAAMHGHGYSLCGSLPKKTVLFFPLWARLKHPAWFLQQWKRRRRTIEDSIHIITFKGLKDFYPGYIISRRKNTKVLSI
ncbi:MAG: hypothetical protein MZU91_04380 [Desulfosudis oleivorans]|nr:hypothetical protein [Desulfosudis oleivorans]